MKKEFKDASNERINKFLEQLDRIMEEEDRGYIFAPVVQIKGDHRSFLRVKAENPIFFWATLVGIVENYCLNYPEENRDELVEMFVTFVSSIAERCFPASIKTSINTESE